MSLILEETPVMKGYKMGELHVLVARERFRLKCNRDWLIVVAVLLRTEFALDGCLYF